MASLICKYCGSYLNDTDEICKECGATNEHYKRIVDGTPKTIEELKQWYKDRKLPPEETTRFFIGKNIKQPRAFGIYEENGKFIVYKNKNDGSRAIRYQGQDEAYAVNEIYLRLKEEILNQKKTNSKKAHKSLQNKHSSLSTANDVRISNWEPVNRQAKPYTHNRPMTPVPQRSRPSSSHTKPASFIVLLIVLFVMGSIVSLFEGLFVDWTSDLLSGFLTDNHYHYYYMGSDDTMYFLDTFDAEAKTMSWWVFDEGTQQWKYHHDYPSDGTNEIVGPNTVDVKQSYYSVHDFASEYNKNSSLIDITTNHEFIDAGHHYSPSTSYYGYDGKVYYYLDDTYSSYGSSDNSGWYVYNENGWEYYCSADDKALLGDDLYYNEDNYSLGNDYIDIYSYTDEYSYTWNPTNFEDTDWYSNYESNIDAYDDYVNSYDDYDYDYDYDYDDDYDWDWDSGSDWDSGGSDWDSDW